MLIVLDRVNAVSIVMLAAFIAMLAVSIVMPVAFIVMPDGSNVAFIANHS